MNDLLSLDNPAPTNNVKHAASSNDLLNFGGVSIFFMYKMLQNVIVNLTQTQKTSILLYKKHSLNLAI